MKIVILGCFIILIIGIIIFYITNNSKTNISSNTDQQNIQSNQPNNQIEQTPIPTNSKKGNTSLLYTFTFNTSFIDNNITVGFNGAQLGIPLGGVYLVTTSINQYSATAIVSFWGTADVTNVSLLTSNGISFSGNYGSGKVLSITNNTGSKIQLTLYFQLLGPIAKNSFYSSSSITEVLPNDTSISYDAEKYGITVLGTYLITAIPNFDNRNVDYGNAGRCSGVGIVCFGLNENKNVTVQFVKTLHNYCWSFSLDMNINTGINNLRITYSGGANSAATLYFQLLADITPNSSLTPFYSFAFTTTTLDVSDTKTYNSSDLGIKTAGIYIVSTNIGKWNETAILHYKLDSNNLQLNSFISFIGHGIIINSNNNLLQITNLTDSENSFTLYFLRIG